MSELSGYETHSGKVGKTYERDYSYCKMRSVPNPWVHTNILNFTTYIYIMLVHAKKKALKEVI